MAGFRCPYCGQVMTLNEGCYVYYGLAFENLIGISERRWYRGVTLSGFVDEHPGDQVNIHFYKCPQCEETTIKLVGVGASVEGLSIPVRPLSEAIQYPDYIPLQIRQDYEEAYAIVHLSPKASATLSRRCLQGMIRDFHEITRNSLFEEINALEEISGVTATQKNVLQSFKEIGNLGAHPEDDVNLIIDISPENAIALLEYIEILIRQWYFDRHDVETKEASIRETAKAIRAQRAASISPSK